MIYEYISTTLILLLIACLLWFINYSLSVYKVVKKYSHIPGPQPKGIKSFFFGDIPTIIQQDLKGVSMQQYLSTLVDIYGKTFKFRMFNNIVIFSIEPKVVKDVFIEKSLPKPSSVLNIVGYPGGERFLGNGLVSEIDYLKWKSRRALLNPGFHRNVLKKFVQEFNSKSDTLVEYLKKKADGKTEVVLLNIINHTTLDVIASVAFSMNIDSLNNPNNKFNDYIFYALSNIKHYIQDPLITFKPHKWNFVNKHRKSIRYLRKIGRDQIISRLEMIKANQELPNDILTVILKTQIENEEFDIELMVDDFVTFFIAGQETTASLLSSLFLEIGRNKEIFEKIRDEIDTIVGTKSEISFEDVNNLKYTGNCIKETLRLWPPVPQVMRYCNKDIDTEKFTIPAGARIATSTYASGRCQEYFEDPLKFNPERFEKLDSDSIISNYIYYPFSLGARNCIGQNFAQVEAKIIIAKFIQNFDYKLNPNQSFAAILAGTLRPKDGTKCYITIRN